MQAQENQSDSFPVDSLPIPVTTSSRRSPKVQSCARAYIHPITETERGRERVTDIEQLAKKFDIGVSHLGKIVKEDRWQEFARALESEAIARAMKDDERRGLALFRERTAQDMLEINKEIERQHAVVDTLRKQAGKVESRLKNCEPGSAKYSRLIRNLSDLRKEIEHCTGKASLDAEEQKRREIAASGMVRHNLKRLGCSPSPASNDDGFQTPASGTQKNPVAINDGDGVNDEIIIDFAS